MTKRAAGNEPFEETVTENLGVFADLAVVKQAVRADLHAIAELHLALEYHVDVERDVAPAGDFAADVEPRRIDYGNARAHQVGSAVTAIVLSRRQRQLVRQPENFCGRCSDDGLDHAPIADGGPDAVGQIILPLRIVGPERAEPAAQPSGGCGKHSRVDLRHLACSLWFASVSSTIRATWPVVSRTTRP